MTRSHRLCALLAALLASSALTACGKHESTGRIRTAETEGIYLDVGGLKYQVQVSRQLNPLDVQDKAYLGGISKADQRLSADQVWFGVFLRVQNEGHEALAPATDIQIKDTQDEVFRPFQLQPSNLYAYRSQKPIPAGTVMPALDSPGFDTPSRGALVLFKLTLKALNNRPLELRIEGRRVPQQTGVVDLDV